MVALAITVVVAELSLPLRRDAGARTGARPVVAVGRRPARGRPLLAAAGVVVVLGACYVAVDPYDRAAGGDEATFEAPPTDDGRRRRRRRADRGAAAPPAAGWPIVGDSQAHSLAVNLPDGIESTFAVTDGSLDGCSVYDDGRVHSARDELRQLLRDVRRAGSGEWAGAGRRDAEIALVVLGAWDVFDLETGDGTRLDVRHAGVGRPTCATNLQSGIDALAGAGAASPCSRCRACGRSTVEGAGVPPLPERGDDARVAHVNELFRAGRRGQRRRRDVRRGPRRWCADEAVATDVGMRWDGVHVYKPGAKLIYDTIAPALLAL